MAGFSLIEVLLVVAIMGILAALGTSSYFGYLKNVEIDSVSREIVSVLREAQGRAMAGDSGKKWGVHFVNGDDDYYELFSTATDYSGGTAGAATYLRPGVEFVVPSPGGSLDVIFSRISGTTAATSTVVISSAGGTATTTVTAIGNIY